jgi:23S rRNA pseudouridine2605 synthase
MERHLQKLRPCFDVHLIGMEKSTSRIQTRQVGLARALSKLGYCSRSQAGKLIRAGRVRLNGTVRRDPESPVRMGKDRIYLDHQPLEASRRVYLMMNKPRGIVTTASDEKGRKTVYAFLAPDLPWLAPVGRLDKASEGLLLLTNDSEWSGKVMAPETHLDKTYHVQIDRIADQPLLESMLRGVKPSDHVLRVKRVSVLRSGEKNSWLEVVLNEGKNRQIRRILEGLGVEVLRLIRVAMGPLQLGELPKGSTRFLTAAEKLAMDRALNLSVTGPSTMSRKV